VEAGIPYYKLISAQIVDGSFPIFPENRAGFYAGPGMSLRRFELGLRTKSNPISSIQATAGIRF